MVLLVLAQPTRKLVPRVEEGGKTLVPLKIYWKHGVVKVEIALARGKKLYDKREAKREKDDRRAIERAMMRRR